MVNTWRPFLSQGDLAERSLQAIEEIAAALKVRGTEAMDPSLANGHAGLALFWSYFAAALGHDEAADRATAHLQRAAAELGEVTTLGLYGGVTGVAWANQRVERLLNDEIAIDASAALDEILVEALVASPWSWEYDLVRGLVGIGCYAKDHPDDILRSELLYAVIERLTELAVEQDGGLTWWTAPIFLHPSTAEKFPKGYYNLGVAHGVAGVIGLLSYACSSGIARAEAERLLRGAVAWLLARRRPQDGGSLFSYFLSPDQGQEAASCRSAWCYGDPGIAVMLLQAAHALGEPAWKEEGLKVARNDVTRPLHETGVVDAGLCHGAAGLGHLYNRAYQATGEEWLKEKALDWFEQTLQMKGAESAGIAGFASWWPEARRWSPDPGFLAGAAGIGLALLGAISPIEPDWDRCLLLDVNTAWQAPDSHAVGRPPF